MNTLKIRRRDKHYRGSMDPEFLRSMAFDPRYDQELLGLAIQVRPLIGVRANCRASVTILVLR